MKNKDQKPIILLKKIIEMEFTVVLAVNTVSETRV